jgi:hypothetical protein
VKGHAKGVTRHIGNASLSTRSRKPSESASGVSTFDRHTEQPTKLEADRANVHERSFGGGIYEQVQVAVISILAP